VHTRAHEARRRDDADVASRNVQRPSLDLSSRSRLADWPCRRTPSSPGRRTRRSAAASPGPARPCRIGGDDVIDHPLDRAEVGDLLHAAGLDQHAGSPPPARRSRTDLGDFRRSCPRRSDRRLPQAGRPRPATPRCPALLLSRPNNSLITQLARACRRGPVGEPGQHVS